MHTTGYPVRTIGRGLFALLLAAHLPAAAGVVRQVTDVKTALAGPGALDDAGTAIFTGASGDPLGINPQHRFQILRFDAATGTPSQITDAPRGTSLAVSASDDGQWIAFVSPDDLTGGNHDLSPEVFAMRSDGSETLQLTDDPAVNAGSVSLAVLSGNGNRVVFLANTDPLGSNPDRRTQLFVVDRDASGLGQLTQVVDGSFGSVGISDDGTRVVFTHDADLAGGNPDLGDEVFAINADGTGLRQLTDTPAGFDSNLPSLSGDGQKVAFQTDADLVGANPLNQDEIFIVDWDGTGLAQLTETVAVFGFTGDPASQFPSITDDGSRVFFHSNYNAIFVNFDGNFEVFSIATDGTDLDQVTSTFLSIGSFLPVVSGDGSRIAYYGIGDEIRLRTATGAGDDDLELLAFDVTLTQQPDVSPDGSRAVFVQSSGLFALADVWRVGTDGSDLAQVTDLSTGTVAGPSIAGDGETIVFSAGANPSPPDNDDGSEEIFLVRSDGTGLTQLTSGDAETASGNPVIAADASVVVFDSDADLVGANADGSREIFAVAPDGTGLTQLTSGPAGTESRFPRVDAVGAWAVFESSADLDGGNPDGTVEIYRVRTDGSLLERLTGDPLLDALSPDISGSGGVVTFATAADPLGSNPETNSEVFSLETASGTLRQLTSSVEGDSGSARVSGDGAWVYFSSSAPFFEEDPDDPIDLYRVPASGGPVERVGALRAGILGATPVDFGGGEGLAVDDAGEVAAVTGIGDFTEANPDLLPELWVIDRGGGARISVSPDAPTVVSWTHESGPLRYDVVRGSVSSLRFDAGGTVDLGDVTCLEDDSPDANTAGFGDPDVPAPGETFFFVYRGTQGLLDGPGSYGAASNGAEREAASGDCDP